MPQFKRTASDRVSVTDRPLFSYRTDLLRGSADSILSSLCLCTFCTERYSKRIVNVRFDTAFNSTSYAYAYTKCTGHHSPRWVRHLQNQTRRQTMEVRVDIPFLLSTNINMQNMYNISKDSVTSRDTMQLCNNNNSMPPTPKHTHHNCVHKKKRASPWGSNQTIQILFA